MDWLRALQQCRERRVPAVLVTVAGVRGHAPREAGAKMVVTADDTVGSVGGGNLEEAAVRRARAMLASDATVPEQLAQVLSDKAPIEHGVQCCGGEVSLLLEPFGVRPSVAVFGLGHVGFEISLLLSRHDVELHVVDSRAEQLAADRVAVLGTGAADVHAHEVPVLPELVVADLPRGTHVLVLTHDHAEDLALVDALLRSDVPATIGLIGSSAKWARFRAKLADLGHGPAAVDRVRTPIGGADGLPGKAPAVIAVSVVAELLRTIAAGASRPIGQ